MTRRLLPLAAILTLTACGNPPVDHTINAGPRPTTTTRPTPAPTADPTAGVDQAMWRATSTTQRASRSRPRTTVAASVPARSASGARTRRVVSTAYCLQGVMANGQRVYSGAVAMNGEPFGSRWHIVDGPLAGRTLVVADRIGHSSSFDIAMPGQCATAIKYGRRTITIQRVD